MRELINILEKIKYEKDGTVHVSIVGAGGKTTLLYALGRHLKEAGHSVLMTTTTMVFYPEPQEAGRVILGTESFKDYIGKTDEKLTLLGSHIIDQSGIPTTVKKIKGFEKAEMEYLEKTGLFKNFDFVLIEADGAKQKPIKAPNEKEPVVVDSTDIIIGLVGMDALDATICEETVHRMNEFNALLDKKPGEFIGEKDIVKLVLAESGLFKNSPIHAKKVLVFNKSEGVEKAQLAERIVQLIRKQSGLVDYFLITSLEQWLIYKCLPLKITKVVFGAGKGTRMGSQKLLLDLNSVSIIEKVMDTVESITSSDWRTETIVVYSDDKVRETAEKYHVDRFVKNPEPERGMSSSLKLAVENASKDTDAYMFFMGDQPFITKDTSMELIKLWLKDTTRIVVPYFAGKRGNPTIFSSVFQEKLLKVTGDKGGREVILSNLDKVAFLDVENSLEGLDIDDPETYEGLKGGQHE